MSRAPPTVARLLAPEIRTLDRALAAATRTRARAYILLAMLLTGGACSFLLFIDGVSRLAGFGGILP